jgi:hypothetical protein
MQLTRANLVNEEVLLRKVDHSGPTMGAQIRALLRTLSIVPIVKTWHSRDDSAIESRTSEEVRHDCSGEAASPVYGAE